MTRNRYGLIALLLVVATATACSDGAARQTLTSPSPADVSFTTSALSADRTTPSRPATSDEVAAWASAHRWSTAADGIVMEATHAITAVAGTCPTKTVTMSGVPVALNATTTFTAPLTCSGLAVGDTVTVSVLLNFTADGFTVTATNVAPVSDDGDTDGEPTTPGTGGSKKARGEGVVGSITGSCPTITMVITGTKVSTTATTTYVNGTCETLRPGTKVTIDGALSPGGTATAEKIEIHRVPGRPVSGDGVVGQVAGACPTLTMYVRGVKVTTSATTEFTGGVCGDIRSGTDIDVTGDYDGSEVVATAVHIKRRPGA